MEINLFRPIFSVLTFGISAHYNKEVDGLFVDNVAYSHHWRKFMTTTLSKWQSEVLISAGLLVSHSAFMILPILLPLAYCSASLAMLGIASGAALLHRHDGLQHGSGEFAYAYLDETRSRYFKFQGLASAYSLPRAFLLWTLIAIGGQWIYLLSQVVSPGIFAFIFSAIACIFAIIYYSTWRQPIIPYAVKDFCGSLSRRLFPQRDHEICIV